MVNTTRLIRQLNVATVVDQAVDPAIYEPATILIFTDDPATLPVNVVDPDDPAGTVGVNYVGCLAVDLSTGSMYYNYTQAEPPPVGEWTQTGWGNGGFSYYELPTNPHITPGLDSVVTIPAGMNMLFTDGLDIPLGVTLICNGRLVEVD